MKRFVAWLVLGAALLGVVAFGAFQISPAVQDAVLARAARAQLERGAGVKSTDDALRVLLCGTSGPMPDRKSAKACTLVAAGGHWFLVDIGPEASENLVAWRIPVPEIRAVLLTHYHSDHIGELGEFNLQGWVQGRRKPLDVYGPAGIEQVVEGFNAAYAPDRTYRNAHHERGRGLLPLTAAVMRPRLIATGPAGEPPTGRKQVILETGGLVVTAIETDHRPVSPSVAYRFDYRGRSVVITGDTVYYPPLMEASRGVDLLVSEAESHHVQAIIADEAAASGATGLATVLRDTLDYHLNPVQAARMANEAGVRELVYTHIAPPIPMKVMEGAWLRGVAEVRKQGTRVGHDGMLITLPADSTAIQFGEVGN